MHGVRYFRLGHRARQEERSIAHKLDETRLGAVWPCVTQAHQGREGKGSCEQDMCEAMCWQAGSEAMCWQAGSEATQQLDGIQCVYARLLHQVESGSGHRGGAGQNAHAYQEATRRCSDMQTSWQVAPLEILREAMHQPLALQHANANTMAIDCVAKALGHI